MDSDTTLLEEHDENQKLEELTTKHGFKVVIYDYVPK